MADTVLKDDETTISCDQALTNARVDAESAYRDLSAYCITISLDEGTWLVNYEPPKLQPVGDERFAQFSRPMQLIRRPSVSISLLAPA